MYLMHNVQSYMDIIVRDPSLHRMLFIIIVVLIVLSK